MLVDYERHEYISGKEKLLCPSCRSGNAISRMIHPKEDNFEFDDLCQDLDDELSSIPKILLQRSIGKVNPPSPKWSMQDHYNFMKEYDSIVDLSTNNESEKMMVAKKYGFTPANAGKYFWKHYLNDIKISEYVINNFIILQKI